ncbi:hypothetical protein [Streptomyces sp. NPDC002520]
MTTRSSSVSPDDPDISPEHAAATVDVPRAAGVDRSVADVTRLITLLTRPPRDTDSADEAIGAAGQQRPVDGVSRLMEPPHRTPAKPHRGRAAVPATPVNRPVEGLAELLAGRVAARPGGAHTGPQPAPPAAESVSARSTTPPATTAPAKSPAATISVVKSPTAKSPSTASTASPASSTSASASPAASASAAVSASASASATSAPETGTAVGPRTSGGLDWCARATALAVFLCGAAHAPRYWTGPASGVLGATLLASGACVLLALALLVRTPQVRLGAATCALAVAAALVAAQALGGRSGLPDPALLQAALLAPPWLAGTAAAVAALAALTVLLTGLTVANLRHDEGS